MTTALLAPRLSANRPAHTRETSEAANWLPATSPTTKVPRPRPWWTWSGSTGKARPMTRKPTRTTAMIGSSVARTGRAGAAGGATDADPAVTAALGCRGVDADATCILSSPSEAGAPQHLLGIPGALDPDGRGHGLDLVEVVGGERDGERPQVLVEALDLPRAEQRDDPRLPGEQPRQGDLRRRGPVPPPYGSEQIDQGPVRLACRRREAGNPAAEVGGVERRARVDFAGEEALPQR